MVKTSSVTTSLSKLVWEALCSNKVSSTQLITARQELTFSKLVQLRRPFQNLFGLRCAAIKFLRFSWKMRSKNIWVSSHRDMCWAKILAYRTAIGLFRIKLYRQLRELNWRVYYNEQLVMDTSISQRAIGISVKIPLSHRYQITSKQKSTCQNLF